MKTLRILVLMTAISSVLFAVGFAQERMNKEDWQREVDRYTQMNNELRSKSATLTKDIESLQAQSSKLDADYTRCKDELYAMVGSNAQEAAAFSAEIEAAENKANELLRLSDAELMQRSSEVTDLAAKAKGFRQNRLAILPEFSERLDALDQKVESLQRALAGAEKWYTVGTWARDRDCLWNIAKKKDIYNNAWLWPKIWMGNKDQIRNPDLIYPGQKLRVPAGGELTAEEKAAARRHYSKN
ncbi:MAG TPA: LysM peptidoglycan-binding domain-containing protein [Bacteroidota bacterium]|nr:LysM peptidoglycan-binding domain-containing protein [Bacteroidota bacterium]